MPQDAREDALANPALGGEPYATPTLWAAVQYLGPAELAPAHRHAQGAFRFVLEGEGVWTVVDGDPVAMRRGDLLLTRRWPRTAGITRTRRCPPSWSWRPRATRRPSHLDMRRSGSATRPTARTRWPRSGWRCTGWPPVPPASAAGRSAPRSGRCSPARRWVTLGDQPHRVGTGDLFAVPSWCPVTVAAQTATDLFRFSDAPVYEALNLARREEDPA